MYIAIYICTCTCMGPGEGRYIVNIAICIFLGFTSCGSLQQLQVKQSVQLISEAMQHQFAFSCEFQGRPQSLTLAQPALLVPEVMTVRPLTQMGSSSTPYSFYPL